MTTFAVLGWTLLSHDLVVKVMFLHERCAHINRELVKHVFGLVDDADVVDACVVSVDLGCMFFSVCVDFLLLWSAPPAVAASRTRRRQGAAGSGRSLLPPLGSNHAPFQVMHKMLYQAP